MTEERSKFTSFVIILAAIIAWMHDGFSLVLISVLANDLKVYFGVGDAAIGLVISLQFICTVPGAILFGEIGDRYGRKTALILSTAWDACFSALTALVPPDGFIIFLILRLTSGLGVSFGISFSLISEHFTPRRRGAAGGLVASTFVIGYISAIIAVLFISPFGWQYCFLTALFPLPFLVLFWFTLPESEIWSEFDEISKERKTKQKIRVKEIFSRKWLKITLLLTLLYWLTELAYHMTVDLAPVLLEYIFTYAGASNPRSSALILMLILMLIGGSVLIVFGALSDSIGRKKAFYVDAIIGLIGSAMFGIFLFLIYDHTMIIVSTIFLATSFGMISIFGVWSSELYDTEMRASANGVIFSIARGLSFGGFIVGLISDILNPYSTTSERLAHPLISARALGVGLFITFFAFLAILIVLSFVPEPEDKEIIAMAKERKHLKP